MNSTPTSSLRTESAQALCWFILWGSVSGHCLNAFWKGRLIFDPQPHSNPIFEVLFAAYSTPHLSTKGTVTLAQRSRAAAAQLGAAQLGAAHPLVAASDGTLRLPKLATAPSG